MKSAIENVPDSDLIFQQQIGRMGVELLAKATLCAGGIALIAGITAALFGS